MPFIANTPESLVARSDSKNPATTCRGITSGGRPCRRPIAALGVNQKSGGGVLLLRGRLRVDDPRDERLYCWQHREQASISARSSPGPQASTTPILEERTSLDTLADRLNLLGVKTRRGSRRTTGGAVWGAEMPSDTAIKERVGRPKTKPAGTISFCFCFNLPSNEDPLPPPHPRLRPQPGGSANASSFPGTNNAARLQHADTNKQAAVQVPHFHRPHISQRSSTASQTMQYLSLIPPTVLPQTASALMAELAKPVSRLDEPGYIYMFWLTPESQQATPPAEAARSLLTPTSRPAGGERRRASDVVASFAADSTPSPGCATSGKEGDSIGLKRSRNGDGKFKGVGHLNEKPNGTLLLKIGRANNVQRRLNEWKRQCGYNLSVLRFYPYIPSSARSPGVHHTAVPRKMPHSHKVERLIHIELSGSGLQVADGGKCGVCGREHREWFRVDATRQAIKEVDNVIRRWVDWDEHHS